MEKWQLAGIISGNAKSKLILPTGKLSGIARKEQETDRFKAIGTVVQKTLRKMTEVIALF